MLGYDAIGGGAIGLHTATGGGAAEPSALDIPFDPICVPFCDTPHDLLPKRKSSRQGLKTGSFWSGREEGRAIFTYTGTPRGSPPPDRALRLRTAPSAYPRLDL